jgi:hypothetical protein
MNNLTCRKTKDSTIRINKSLISDSKSLAGTSSNGEYFSEMIPRI